MTQVAKPADDDFAGRWTPTPLWQNLRGGAVRSGDLPPNDWFQVQLEKLAWPAAGPEVLRVWVSGDGTAWVLVELLQGGQVIAWELLMPNGDTLVTLTLTDGQIAQISDYTDLHVMVQAGPVQVDCCPQPLPPVLYANISNGSGCACLAGQYPLLWDPLNNVWRFTGDACGLSGNLSIGLRCLPTGHGCESFSLDLACSNGVGPGRFYAGAFPDTCTCSPLLLTYASATNTNDACCSGTIQGTITETQ
jgi:hypothetical protein